MSRVSSASDEFVHVSVGHGRSEEDGAVASHDERLRVAGECASLCDELRETEEIIADVRVLHDVAESECATRRRRQTDVADRDSFES